MGLNRDDRLPEGISMREAYSAVRSWYKQNCAELANRDDSYARGAEALIAALPSESLVTDLEIRAVFGQVIGGFLEWGYHQCDGSYKMAAYALAALEESGYKTWLLNQTDMEDLKGSRLWPHIFGDRGAH